MNTRKISFMLCVIIVLFGLNAPGVFAKTKYISLRQKTGVTKESISTEKMTKKIIEAAKIYEKNAPIPRITLVDTCVPRTLEEYKAMDTNCIVMITAVTQNKEELPLKRAYIFYEDMTVPLELLGSITVKVKDPLTKKVFGAYRVDSYYLIPYVMTLLDYELSVDWAKNREKVVVYKYSGEVKPAYLIGQKGLFMPKYVPVDKKVLKKFLLDEFGVSFPEKK